MKTEFQSGLVSVIVPVYEVEEYLRECLDSIINQTYKNLEIILVDDGSPDNCGKICEEYAAHDQRITVYHKENGGLSDARNYGIERCNGEFITFIDSDDVIKSTYVEVLINLQKKYNADLAVASVVPRFREMPETGADSLFPQPKFIRHYLFSSYQAIKSIVYKEELSVHVGAPYKLYRRELFKDIRYPVGRFYEDWPTTYRIFNICRCIALTNESIYAYRINFKSIMYTKFSPKMLSCIPNSRQIYNEIKEMYPDLETAAASVAFSGNELVFFSLPPDKKEERKKVWAELIKYRKMTLLDKKVRMRFRILALLSYSGFHVFHMLSGLYVWYRRNPLFDRYRHVKPFK